MTEHRGALSPETRRQALERMAREEFDLAIIGGGVVGCGAALDAASRGLSVALVEARDLASGTSSRSSKLIHGGLRYLEQLEFGLVREALHERALMLDRLSPHLVRPLPFLALLSHKVWERPYIASGLLLYDTMGTAMGRGRGVPAQKHYTRRQTLKKFPALRRDAFTGAVQYYDAQVDDARHTMFLARTAAAYGAQIAPRAQAVGFLREGEHVTGVRIVDLEASPRRVVALRAKQTINATGVWTDDTQDMVGARGQFHVRASKGVHLLVPRDRIHGSTALTIRTETSVLFVIPWGRHWIIGTTDTDWELDKSHPAASRKDIEYLLGEVNKYLNTPLGHDDVEGVYAGLRPLLAGESEDTSALSREHVVAHPVPGLVAVAGGKYTTYRVMAKDAVDAAVHGLGEDVPRSITERVPLLGADGYLGRWNGRHRLAQRSGLHVARIEHLLHRYGALIDDVLSLIAEDPSLGRPLEGAEDYLAAEIVYAATHEGASHLEDVLTRRTRISIETWDRGLRAAEPAARLMAKPLGWSKRQVLREVEHYRTRVAAERQSQLQDDDLGADAARLGAPDIAPTLPVERLPTGPDIDEAIAAEEPAKLSDVAAARLQRARDELLVPFTQRVREQWDERRERVAQGAAARRSGDEGAVGNGAAPAPDLDVPALDPDADGPPPPSRAASLRWRRSQSALDAFGALVAAGCGGRASDAAEIRETRVVDVHVHGDQADVVLEHHIGGTPIRATGHAVREHGRWVVADTGKAATAGRLRVYRVPSEAMEPTIKVGTTVLIDTTRYRAAAPALGDIVTFHPPKGAEIPRCPVHRPGAPCAKEAPQPESVAFIKRIVAGPGDRVAIRAGHVVRNGRTLDEPYTRRCADGTGCDFPKAITVPPDHYYLLGDDRGNSDDSRFWGPVPRRWIIGKVVRQLH